MIQVNAYDAYGIPKEGNAGRFGYTGQTWLPQIGINYYKARMYSPKLGRFLQTDPIFYEDDFALYAYAGNDPVNTNDPTGNAGVPCGGDLACLAQLSGDRISGPGITLGGIQTGLGGASAVARGVEIGRKGAAGFGPPSTVVPGLVASQAASTVLGALGAARTAVSAAKIGTNLHDGNVRGAAENGLELGERMAGAATGAKLFGRLGPGPIGVVGAAVGATAGGLAPSLMDSINESIVDAGAAGAAAASAAYDEIAAEGGKS